MSNAQSKDSVGNKQEILKERARLLARPIEKKDYQTDLIEIVPFKLNQENFALETRYVKEIYPLKNHTFLPCAPAFVYGLTNVRRRISPIIDLKVIFALPSSVSAGKKLLIIENEDVEFAILIDSFGGIRSLKKIEIQTGLPTLTGVKQDFLKGIIVDGTVILDGQKLLTSSYLMINTGMD